MVLLLYHNAYIDVLHTRKEGKQLPKLLQIEVMMWSIILLCRFLLEKRSTVCEVTTSTKQYWH